MASTMICGTGVVPKDVGNPGVVLHRCRGRAEAWKKQGIGLQLAEATHVRDE